MRVAVIGKEGQLARALQDEAQTSSYHFIGSKELDITDAKAVHSYFEQHSFDVIINCAAYTNVDGAEDDQAVAKALNHTALRHLVDQCKIHQMRLIHISTDYVFDGNATAPYKEEATCNPISIYGKTKRKGELEILQSDIDALIIRTTWLYSAYGHNFVKTMLKLAASNTHLKVVSDQIGRPTYANDLAKALIALVNRTQEWPIGASIYHFSNSGQCSWADFARAIFKAQKLEVEVKNCDSTAFPTKAQRPQFSVLDLSKIQSHFQLVPRPWEAALAACLEQL
jgi:dTDP-4-dehydrorhamnose reductase